MRNSSQAPDSRHSGVDAERRLSEPVTVGATGGERAGPRRTMTSRIRARTTSWAANSERIKRGRERRYQLFMELCRVRPEERILDVGAGKGAALERFNSVNPIVAVDLVPPSPTGWLDQENVEVGEADGTKLPYAEREFPVVFSNSVIEHVPSEQQHVFASEIRRVSERYYVQTPNKWFPIEPHYQMPLVQFLPDRVLKALNRRFSFGFREKGRWEPVNLLSARELRRMFPDAQIHRERLFGLTKSLMAVRSGVGSPGSPDA